MFHGHRLPLIPCWHNSSELLVKVQKGFLFFFFFFPFKTSKKTTCTGAGLGDWLEEMGVMESWAQLTH